ncbi:MAG: hypothetical protein A3H42_04425 [Deltaproteobacteria bacterium RIFCSPLOWO2_02_FULL_46_8]|nr:MAG: hypothetical protein A3H42_04425 [Deltaproteobacteria bacterium RIFCSPLOWO2_02_FULL_46_8]
MSNFNLQEIYTTKEAVFHWLEKDQWKGWDPFDGLASPYFNGILTSENTSLKKWLGIILLQVVKRSPFNLRPLLKIPRQENPMTWASGLLGVLESLQREKKSSPLFVKNAVQKLIDLSDPKTSLWGYPFPWTAKAFYLKPGEPNLVLSSLCLRALAKAILVLEDKTEQARIGREHYQKAVNNLFQIFYKPNEGYFSYVAHEMVLVHNANLFGIEAVFYLKSLGIEISTQQEEWAKKALQKTLSAQSPFGRWSYGTKSHHQWCDNFHTAYNLIALANIYRLTQDIRIPSAIQKGLTFYLSHAFTQDGKARYYENKTWPIETHSATAALICLSEMVKGGWLVKEQAQAQAQKIWKVLKIRACLGNGRFIYREGRLWKVRTVFNRWTQSWVYYGLESLLSLFT